MGESKHISVNCVVNDSWLDVQCNNDGSQCFKKNLENCYKMVWATQMFVDDTKLVTAYKTKTVKLKG